jgi:hypothetical protein
MKEKIEILKPMRPEGLKNSMWYGGTVALLEVGPYKFELVANGDVEAELWEDDETFLAEVKDTENLGAFYGVMRSHIQSDEALQSLQHRMIGGLIVNYNNWWEIFVSCNGIQMESVACDTEFYDEAIEEMIAFAEEKLQPLKPYFTPAVVYVYHEHNDADAFGEMVTKVFSSMAAGKAYLKKRVEQVYKATWEEVTKMAGEDDTVKPDYVSISNGNGCAFFTLTRASVDDDNTKEKENA